MVVAEATRSNVEHERLLELANKQVSCIERTLALLEGFSPKSKRRAGFIISSGSRAYRELLQLVLTRIEVAQQQSAGACGEDEQEQLPAESSSSSHDVADQSR
ncbi:hypothetical protein, conserved [Eimeria acervulina]|uniref:Uncharacterized protein n=1 Tax=Eimeria acervulina TaxID=5801 RepID=U6GMK0_EIMAC|nr:hypothetical protein, conserved [Eimeria acervulina]CDI81410.1 hypothetical protein, conserved [Eimeria acervulina]